ncbi:MAG: FAD-dependent thymidylate synthase [Chloroflexi bacterium]|nr:FAD-dependent thymidylate synthase [Chloroflexota bacterium]MBI3339032.1 FAD-dependent thymidylate synthase [Chloroflexota bacterium]
MPEQQIYLLSPKELSPETIAVAFAKTSRSPESFREIAADLNDEKSAKFHEKWVVGYGHASVAEHAVLHIAFENVSRLAIESIESNRLGSYTEKSTRYQKWGADDFFIPAELDGHPLRNEYIAACRLLFSTYNRSLDPVRTLVLERFPRRENESDEGYDRRIRSQYVDVCRFILPAASLANVGMTANARVLESMIRKMLSSSLTEVKQIGGKVKEVAKAEIPTLVKYADEVPYLMETSHEIGRLANREFGIEHREADEWCTLIDYDKDGEKKILAAALYRFGEMSYADALAHVHAHKKAERTQLAEVLMKRLGRYDVPLRELEYCSYIFDLVMDQGAYAEFKRHRMMTQTPQMLTTRHGHAVPRLITEAGFGSEYEAAMNAAADMYEKLYVFNPQAAQYIVPNGYKRRVLAQFNLREAFAFCQLRSAPNAHFSIRRIAERMYEEIMRVHPTLAGFIQMPEETWQGVEEKYFTQT